LPGIYARALGPAALGLVRIYQAKHSSLWYKYNVYTSSKETRNAIIMLATSSL